MKKIFVFVTAALMSVSMFGATAQEELTLAADAWWGWDSSKENVDGKLVGTISAAYGGIGTSFGEADWSKWQKLVVVVDNIEGCAGQWWFMKAEIRNANFDPQSSVTMYGELGKQDHDPAETNYVVIDLTNVPEGFDITKVDALVLQTEEPGNFTVSRIFLEREINGELTYLAVLLPTENRPAADKIEMVGTFDAGALDMEKLDNDYFVYHNSTPLFYAAADDTFKFRDKSNTDMVLCELVDGQWVQAIFKFGDYWEEEPYGYKGSDPCMWFEELFNDAAKYAWKEGMPEPEPTAIENTVVETKAVKVIRDGQIYILRDGKMFNAVGAEVR